MSRDYDTNVARLLAALELEARGWSVLDDSYADAGEITLGAKAVPDRRVEVSSGDNDDGHYIYRLECLLPPAPPDLLGGYDAVETGYHVTLDELIPAIARHLDPTHEPDTKLRKDRSIRRLLARLDIEHRGWVVSDSWQGDLFAIGIGRGTNPRHRVWVATNQHTPERYSYQSEIPTGPEESADHQVIDQADDVSYAELLAALVRHLSE